MTTYRKALNGDVLCPDCGGVGVDACVCVPLPPPADTTGDVADTEAPV